MIWTLFLVVLLILWLLGFSLNVGGGLIHILLVIAVVVLVYNMIRSYYKGKDAGHDPWDAWTLEWSVPSPPPSYNFAIEPTVNSRRPLWDLKHPEDPDSDYE